MSTSRTRLDKASLPDPSYQWTTVKARVFIGGLLRTGCVAAAAHAVGMSRQSAYRLRARLGEGSRFAREWDALLALGKAERRQRRRAVRKATLPPQESDIFGIGK